MHADLNSRRQYLETTPNTDRKLDYISTLKSDLTVSLEHNSANLTTELVIHYIPDRLILMPQSLVKYLQNIEGVKWKSLEEVTTTILTDINNELVSRWLRVEVETISLNEPKTIHHSVVIEDQQPGWENEKLISRISDR